MFWFWVDLSGGNLQGLGNSHGRDQLHRGGFVSIIDGGGSWPPAPRSIGERVGKQRRSARNNYIGTRPSPHDQQCVLRLAGIHKSDGPFDDEQIVTSCPACGSRQALGQAAVRLEAGQTRYRCMNGCRNIAFVSDRILGEHGYKLGSYVFRNLCDVFLGVFRPPTSWPSEIDQSRPASAADDLSSRSAG